MKKILALVLFVSTTLSFTACSSDDDSIHRVDADVQGTWHTDRLSYTFGDKTFDHAYIDMPGDNKVTQNDKLVLTKDKATLTEYFANSPEPVVTEGVINGKVITFNKEGYSPRTINGISNGQLSLQYEYTARESTLVVTVTYNKQ